MKKERYFICLCCNNESEFPARYYETPKNWNGTWLCADHRGVTMWKMPIKSADKP